MIVSPKKKQQYSLFIFSIVLLVLGGTAIFIGSSNFEVRSIGVLSCLISVYLVRISNIHANSDSVIENTKQAHSKPPTHFRRSIWVIGVVLLPILGLSFSNLYRDAIHGYHDVMPVYLFAAVAAICALLWSYLVSRML